MECPYNEHVDGPGRYPGLQGSDCSHLQVVLYAFTHTVSTLDFHFDNTFSHTFTSGTAQLYTHSLMHALTHKHMHTHCHQHTNYDYYDYNPMNHIEVLVRVGPHPFDSSHNKYFR